MPIGKRDANVPSRTPILDENYRFLQEHVYAHAGIVLEEDKHYLFESRLSPIVDRLGLGSINELCAACVNAGKTTSAAGGGGDDHQ